MTQGSSLLFIWGTRGEGGYLGGQRNMGFSVVWNCFFVPCSLLGNHEGTSVISRVSVNPFFQDPPD